MPKEQGIVIPTQSLVLVEGLSREAIEKKLKDAGSGFTFVFNDSERRGFYFRETPVSAHGNYAQLRGSLTRTLGEPGAEQRVLGWGAKKVMSYYALWEMTPEFDRALLNGPISFRKGNLVERTFFYFSE